VATLEAAQRRAEDGDWQAAVTLLRDALQDHPDDPFVLCWLGVAERELGLEGAAYERFKACLAAGPRDAQVLATAGAGLAAFDDAEAEPALRTAAMLAPELAFARWMYGAYLSREGLLDDALRELQAARSLEPDEAVISYELGVALALSGNQDGAVDELYRAVELDPQDGWTRVVLGLALLEEDRAEEALAELVAGARALPEDAEAQLLASLAAAGHDQTLPWEMLERARLSGADDVLAEEVQERLEEGAEAARAFLTGELAPPAFRERLAQRP
jgi:tetratricopeptide (TPR) repeat protein